MKKETIKIAVLIATAYICSQYLGFAQARYGSIVLANLTSYKPRSPVYSPIPSNPTAFYYGNQYTNLLASSGAVKLEGNGYCAWLLAAPGLDRTIDELRPAYGTVDNPDVTYQPFNTGVRAGYWVSTAVLMTNVAPETACTVAVVVWENKGKYYTWDEAKVAWLNGEIAAAVTPTFNITQCGGDFVMPPEIPNFQTFNIYYIPEPAAYVIGGLALAALWVFRKRG